METTGKFEDAENYQGGFQVDKLTFKDIILQHVKKISSLGSVEFRGGYWEQKLMPIGNGGTATTRVYIPDSREMYSNAVECLAHMLSSYFDKEMKSQEEDTINQKKEALIELKVWAKENNANNDRLREEISKAKLKINQMLFRHLCSFLHRKNYLDLGVAED